MRRLPDWLYIVLLLIFVSGMFFPAPARAQSSEIDLKPSLGPSLEQAIRDMSGAYIPSQFLESVNVDRLTVDSSANVRGQVTIQYAQYQEIPGIPGIRRAQRWSLWSARLVIRWTTNAFNPLNDSVVVDVGQIHGFVNTNSVKSTVTNWLSRQAGYIEQYIPSRDTVVGGESGLHFHNRTSNTIWVAVGFRSSNQWVASGWWRIDPGETKTTINGALGDRYYYYYATDNIGGQYAGEYQFWIHRTDKFAKVPGDLDAATAYTRGYESQGFLQIDTGDYTDWTHRLNP